SSDCALPIFAIAGETPMDGNRGGLAAECRPMAGGLCAIARQAGCVASAGRSSSHVWPKEGLTMVRRPTGVRPAADPDARPYRRAIHRVGLWFVDDRSDRRCV